MGEVMVPALELLEVLVVDEALLPEVGEEMEVWAAPLERLAEHGVGVRNVFHPRLPRCPAVVPRAVEVAQRAPDRLGRLLTVEVAQAMQLPLLFVVGHVGAAQEPKGALEDGSAVVWAPLEHAVVVLEQRYARKLTGQPRADRRLGRSDVGVVERGRLSGSVGLVEARVRHGRGGVAGARASAGRAGAVRRRGQHLAVSLDQARLDAVFSLGSLEPVAERALSDGVVESPRQGRGAPRRRRRHCVAHAVSLRHPALCHASLLQ